MLGLVTEQGRSNRDYVVVLVTELALTVSSLIMTRISLATKPSPTRPRRPRPALPLNHRSRPILDTTQLKTLSLFLLSLSEIVILFGYGIQFLLSFTWPLLINCFAIRGEIGEILEF